MPSEALDASESIEWKDWGGKGKQAFHKYVKTTLEKNAVVIDKNGKRSTLPRLFYRLFWNGVHGVVSPENVAEACMTLSELHDEIPSLILDTVTLFDAELDPPDNSNVERKRLVGVLGILNEKWCPELARERLEFDTLSDFDDGTKAFHSKFIKMKTRLYYKQNKFNLYREENEGYAKLMMELNKSGETTCDPNTILGNIRSLIGCFSLDPTRVIDIILDNFQLRPFEVNLFIPLLKKYMPEINLLSEVIGFRYLTFQENGVAPRSLHVMICVMLHYKVIDIDDLYPWLSPDDKEITKEIEQLTAEEKSKKSGPLPPVKSKEEFEKNQKLALCEVAISVGSWKTFQLLLTHIPPSYAIETPQIATAICQFLHYMIAPVYAMYSGFSDKIETAPLTFQQTLITEEQPQSLSDVIDVVYPILYQLGPALRFDLVLLFKLTRISATVLSQVMKSTDAGGKIFYHTTKLLELTLLPTLSNVPANCCVNEAIWNVVKLYPLQTRYSIYYAWRKYCKENQAVIDRRCQGKVSASSCLKRVSKENVKQIGRLLGKLSHYSPATLFDYIVYQIQMYDNLIGPVVDSLKFMTNMSYDVLGFAIFDSLLNDVRQRPKHNETTVLPWFQSTTLFCATVFKKYNIDLSGILLYIMEELKNNRSVELLILKELLQKMTGVDVTDDMTQHQIDSMSGGEHLRSEAGYFVQQQNFKKTATRFKEALVENNLAAPLGIMLAQQRTYIIFNESQRGHLKFVGKLYDECHDTLLQYGAFIAGPIMHDVHANFPSLHDLLVVYKLDMDAAFLLARPGLHAIEKKSESSKKSKKVLTAAESLFEQIDAISSSIEALHPSKQWEDMSPKFVAMFWSLALSDIQVPKTAYEKEIAKQKEQDPTQVKQAKTEGKSHTMADKLTQELKEQQQYVKTIIDHLKKRKTDWFLSRSVKPAKNEMITQFLQMCIFPRSVMSINDALFCAQFIHTLHSISTNNFSTLLCYDRLFCDITFAVMSCTENEASRYGRFLCAVLQNIMRWHSSKEIYDKECANTPGFVTKFRGSNEFSDPNDNVHYENYRHVCHKWHYKVTRSVLSLLESSEYVQIRNGLIVLIKLLPVFPVIGKLAQFIEKRINKVREEEKKNRQDLYTLATSYNGLLLARSSHWINESEFHVVTTTNSSSSDSGSSREDKMDMETENFSSDLPTDIYLSPPSNHLSASPPRSPSSTKDSSSPPPAKHGKPDKGNNSAGASEKSSSGDQSPSYWPSSPGSVGGGQQQQPSVSPNSQANSQDSSSTTVLVVDSDREEGELNKARQKRSRTPRKSREDDKERRKVAKKKIRSSRSGRP